MKAHRQHAALARAFDQVAPGYEALYGPDGNPLMRRLRQDNLARLLDTFPAGSRLLEIGCGTGEEALALARAGRQVLAIDVSPQMAARTAARARQDGLAGRVTALALPAAGLAALQPRQPFDGAYASFGALNCEPDLDRFAGALAAVLPPGAAFVTTVMARWAPVEVLWHLAHLQPGKATRRWAPRWQPAAIESSPGQRVQVQVRYFSVGELARTFAPAFALASQLACLLLLPPPYLPDLYSKHRRFFTRLEPWERRLRGRWPWNQMGDHLALTFRRTAADTPPAG